MREITHEIHMVSYKLQLLQGLQGKVLSSNVWWRMLTRLIAVVIFQHIQILSHCVVQLKVIYSMSIIPKLKIKDFCRQCWWSRPCLCFFFFVVGNFSSLVYLLKSYWLIFNHLSFCLGIQKSSVNDMSSASFCYLQCISV